MSLVFRLDRLLPRQCAPSGVPVAMSIQGRVAGMGIYPRGHDGLMALR